MALLNINQVIDQIMQQASKSSHPDAREAEVSLATLFKGNNQYMQAFGKQFNAITMPKTPAENLVRAMLKESVQGPANRPKMMTTFLTEVKAHGKINGAAVEFNAERATLAIADSMRSAVVAVPGKEQLRKITKDCKALGINVERAQELASDTVAYQKFSDDLATKPKAKPAAEAPATEAPKPKAKTAKKPAEAKPAAEAAPTAEATPTAEAPKAAAEAPKAAADASKTAEAASSAAKGERSWYQFVTHEKLPRGEAKFSGTRTAAFAAGATVVAGAAYMLGRSHGREAEANAR